MRGSDFGCFSPGFFTELLIIHGYHFVVASFLGPRHIE